MTVDTVRLSNSARLSTRETIAEATRLLRHLGTPGHTAIVASLTPERIILSSSRNGVSLGRGMVSIAAAGLLRERGLLREPAPGTFHLTETGRALAARLPDDDRLRAEIETLAPAASAPANGSMAKSLPERSSQERGLQEGGLQEMAVPPARPARGPVAGRRQAGRSRLGSAAGSPSVAKTAADTCRVLREAELREGTESVLVTINDAESPLAWLHRHRDRDGEPFIDATCFEAGERLRRDVTMARIMPRVTSRWSPVGGGSGAGPAAATDAMVSARQRLDRALDAVDGDYAGILLDVCGFLKRIEDVERERRWPARSGKVVLKLALQRLAAHYGLAREARGPDSARRIRSWQTA